MTRAAGVSLLPLLLWMLVLRTVAPGALDLVLEGRPPPGTVQELSTSARGLGLLLALVLLVVAARAVLCESDARTRSATGLLGAAWIAYLVLELASTALHGDLPLVPVATGLLVLLAVARSGPLPPGTVARLVLPLLAVLHACLLLVVVAPATAKFGDPNAPWLSRDGRLAGVLEQPNQVGLLAAVLTVVLASRHCSGSRWRLLHLAVSGSALLLSASYTSWIATACALLVLWAGQYLRNAGVLTLVLAGGGLAAVTVRLLSSRFAGDDALSTFSGRRALWGLVAQGWRERPVLGHGSGVWSRLIAESGVEPWVVHAHNQLLNTLYVGGAVGLVALLVAVTATAVTAGRLWQRGRALPLALLALQLVRSHTEVPFELAFGGLNLVYLVLVLALVRVDERPDPQERR